MVNERVLRQQRMETSPRELNEQHALNFVDGLLRKRFEKLQGPDLKKGNILTILFSEYENDQPLPSKQLRFRAYGLTGLSNIKGDLAGFLEIKTDNEIIKEGKKYRFPIKLSDLERMFSDPGAFKKQISEDNDFSLQFDEIVSNRRLFPYLVVLKERDTYVKDGKHPEDLKITIDKNIRYFGYPYQPDKPTFFAISEEELTKNPYHRVEIKCSNPSNLIAYQQILEELEKISHSANPLGRGRSAYFRRELSRSERFPLGILGTNELPGQEIEAKLELNPKKLDIKTIAKLLIEDIRSSKLEFFKVYDTVPNILSTETLSHRYAYFDKEKKLQEAFVITTNIDGTIHGRIKRKELTPSEIHGSEQNIFVKKEGKNKSRFNVFDESSEAKIIKEQAIKLEISPSKIFFLGTSKRSSNKVNIENFMTGRTYVINVEESESISGQKLSQIEVECGHRRGFIVPSETAIFPIIDDIEKIIQFIKTYDSFSVRADSTSKFEWLISANKHLDGSKKSWSAKHFLK